VVAVQVGEIVEPLEDLAFAPHQVIGGRD
jgi:hypothetical protein